MTEIKKSRADQIRERMSKQSSNSNETKQIFTEALREREKINTPNQAKKLGRKAKLLKENKRDIAITFKTSSKRLLKIESALNNINIKREQEFGTSQMSMSEFIDSLIASHHMIEKD